MGIGATIRKAFGPYEHQIADAWRSIFVDMDDWTRKLREKKPNALRILEVGCGEGAGTEKLVEFFPKAHIDAIDIADNIGRLYRGERSRVTFSREFVEQRAAKEPGSYDLIVLCDVIHHVPEDAQESLLSSIRSLLAPEGVFAMKDWDRNYTPIYWAAYLSDRYLTGDKIRYKTPETARKQLDRIFGADRVRSGPFVRPWRTNYSFFAQASPIDG